jgi:hypothetical protein
MRPFLQRISGAMRVVQCLLQVLLPGVALAQPPKPVVPAATLGATPLAKHANAQKMIQETARRLALANLNFVFLDKTYENDVYAREPISGKSIRASCVRFKARSGFRFRVDAPTFELNDQGLTITQNIARVSANGLRFSFQLGPCVESTAGFGVAISNINFVYRARPLLSIVNGMCTLVINQDPEHFRIAIGGLNVTGVQNDLDKLAKDAVREGINFSLDGAYGSLVAKELKQVTLDFCGPK